MNDLYKYLKNIPTINPNVAVSIAAKDDGAQLLMTLLLVKLHMAKMEN